MKVKYFLIASLILNIVFVLLLLGQQYQIDEQMKAWPTETILECKEMNAQNTRLLMGESLVIRLK